MATGPRIYLDWNASAPLRPEARAAMLSAMDIAGNPSAVHAEGRAARAMVERARAQVAGLVGCAPGDVVFTSGATEGIARVAASRAWGRVVTSGVEHDAAVAAARRSGAEVVALETRPDGSIRALGAADLRADDLLMLQAANGETGVCHRLDHYLVSSGISSVTLCDLTQIAGRPVGVSGVAEMQDDALRDHWRAGLYTHGVLSAHKLGGPKGVGAVIVRKEAGLPPLVEGGGQERGRRAGTENLIGIAGFGAAAEAASADLSSGIWAGVRNLRDLLENALEDAAPDIIFIGRDAPRLPNTSAFLMPGWAGETQVMQMDLAGFAVSAGSACASGKVEKASRVLRAMGFDDIAASSALRVSIGPTTTEAEVTAFANAWGAACRRWKQKAA